MIRVNAKKDLPSDTESWEARDTRRWLVEILLGGLFFVQVGADGESVVRIDCGIALFDVLDDAVFVDDDVGALRPLVGFALHVVALEDAVGRQHLFVHVAEQGKLDIDLFREGGVGRGRIHTDAEDFSIRGVDFSCVDSRLDRLELFGSTTGEGENVDGEEDVFLALKVTKLDGFPLIAEKREIRSGVADFKGGLGDLIILLRGRDYQCGRQKSCEQECGTNEVFH
jgi:hypothetical protein